ncbi:hypothetical protein QTP70_023785, partial [Hemibagrus guttatus]
IMPRPCLTTSVKSPGTTTVVTLPSEYHDLREVVKSRAMDEYIEEALAARYIRPLYIDDILIYSTSLEDHVCHVRMVLSHLLQHNLYVKFEKCKFHCKTITFLGYVLSQEGVEMDQAKVQAVTKSYSVSWGSPTFTDILYTIIAL